MPPALARVISILGHPCILALVDAAAVGVRTLDPAASTSARMQGWPRMEMTRARAGGLGSTDG